MGKKALRFGVSEALLVSAVGAVSAGCFLFEQTEVTTNPGPNLEDSGLDLDDSGLDMGGEDMVDCDNGGFWGCPTINPAPDLSNRMDMSDMSDMCPDEPVECGLNDPSCPCYTINPGPDLPDMVDEASMDDMSSDMQEDMSSDMDADQGEDMPDDMPDDMAEDVSGDM